MRGHLGASKKDQSIRSRLTPQIVLDCGGVTNSEVIDTVDVSKPSYSLLYRIWGNHQKYSFQNKNMGYLEIKKEVKDNKIKFQVNKKIINYENLNQIIEVTLITKNDEEHTPLEYHYISNITDNALCKRDELTLQRKGSIDKNIIYEEINHKKYDRQYNGKLVFDFTVYDLVASNKEISDFIYFENLYAFKPKNKLITIPGYENFGKQKLKRMVQYGRGLTERIFYINQFQIPMMMVQNSVVYIVDTHAKEETELLIEQLNTGGVHYEY